MDDAQEALPKRCACSCGCSYEQTDCEEYWKDMWKETAPAGIRRRLDDQQSAYEKAVMAIADRR